MGLFMKSCHFYPIAHLTGWFFNVSRVMSLSEIEKLDKGEEKK